MEIKKIMKVSDLLPVINLPWNETEQVEVLIVPLHKNDNKNDANLERIKRVQSALSQYANKDLIPLEKEAWQKHCEEKYGNT